MPVFHFHVEDGRSYPDREGTELDNVDAARIEAVRMFGALLNDDPTAFWNGDEWTLTCTDAGQMTMFQICFLAVDAPAAPRKRFASTTLALPT